jgi:hypothetical protein
MSLEDSTNVYGSKKFNKETLPKPSESQIEFRQEPAKNCCNHFGWADDTKIEKYKEKLKAAFRR